MAAHLIGLNAQSQLPLEMNAWDAFSGIILLVLAGFVASAGWAIFRRARRDSEVNVLLWLMGFLSVQLALGGISRWVSGIPLLVAIESCCISGLFALATHFIGLTYLRVTRDQARKAPVLFGWTSRKVDFYAVVVPAYVYGVIRVAIIIRGLMAGEAHVNTQGIDYFVLIGYWVAWWVVQGMTTREAYRRIPPPAKTPWLERMGNWFGRQSGLQTERWQELSIRPQVWDPGTWVETADFSAEVKGLAALGVWSLIAYFLLGTREDFQHAGPQYEAAWSFAMQLLAAAGILPLVYYKTQFVFYDVLMKRGVLLSALIASVAAFYGIWDGVVARTWPEASTTAAVAGGTFVFVLAWTAIDRRASRWLDRYLFHRPDYAALLQQMTEEMPHFVEQAPLLDWLTNRLCSAMSAKFVRFTETRTGERDPEVAGTIPVGDPDQTWGYLEFGKRDKGQPYRSEDLEFLGTIASQLAATLANFDLRRRVEEQRRREVQLRELAAKSELKALQAQINPHFLFNALNTLADLTHTDPKLAEDLIVALAGVFRFALDSSSRDLVPLGEELEFIESYMRIEQARFGTRLCYRMEAPDELRPLLIPPMLIQPLVENAIKHGVSPRPEGGQVTIRATLDHGMLRIEVEDDGAGFDPQRARSGVGLANVRDRVERIAGAGHWHVRSSPGAGTCVGFEVVVERAEVYADTHR